MTFTVRGKTIPIWREGGWALQVPAVCACLLTLACSPLQAAGEIGYNRDIRPLLSDNCFFCHGPDAHERKGKLRLDVRDDAISKGAIVPGKPEESELIARIFSKNEDEQMPPPDSHKKLTSAQMDLLKQWIADGAKYEEHWAYLPPVKPAVPQGQNGIDALVKKRLEKLGMKPSAEADRRTLARRLYFDLAGLPPKPEAVDAFASATNSSSYPALVEQLLGSRHYGERMAIGWLDVARFADTIGYHSDNPRNIWPYRDYVIESFNENKPYDQFTREQLAGDLLPNSTQEQKIGSAFNRLLLTTEEGGAQPKDYEARMLTDRVRAVGAVWMGQTLGCAQCHDHKFDPIKAKDFYAMGAFFADIKEPIIGRREDGMLAPDAAQKAELARLEKALAELEEKYNGSHPELENAFQAWQAQQKESLTRDRQWSALKAEKAESAGGATLETREDNSIFVKGKKPDKDTYQLRFTALPNPISALRLESIPDDALPSKGAGRSGNGNFVITEIIARLERANGDRRTLRFASARADIEQTSYAENNPSKRWDAAAVIDGNSEAYGWAILPEATRRHRLVLELAEPVKLEEGDALALEIKQNHGAGSHTLGRFLIAATTDYNLARLPVAAPLERSLTEALLAESPKASQTEKLFGYLKTIAPELAGLRKDLTDARKARQDFENSIPRCLVSDAMETPRVVRILLRGNFLIETGEIVEPALPSYLPGGEKKDRRLTRLDLANWLTARDNPLTARVFVNRLWKQFFGMGLSKVLDDFGSQGEPPPNQELLDWLACEFMDSGWDVKHLVRLIVNSDTYKQASTPSKELQARDPYNRENAAQSRWRLDAELVRDNALALAGLLSPKIGGPSAKPYQPDGYWENLNFPARSYDASKGEEQYRRGVYVWSQRSFPHPSMIAFDAPTREECVAERNRSNIPQQALVLLNDPTYVEASRSFAARILQECGGGVDERIRWAWRETLSRLPDEDELTAMRALLAKHLAEFQQQPEEAKKFLSVGLKPAPQGMDEAELAAWTNVARVLLNLHETLTRS